MGFRATTTGLALSNLWKHQLSRKELPLLPFFLIRDSHGYHFEMEKLIVPPARVKDDPEVTDRVTHELSQSIERAIRRHPSQWPWMHDRWRSTPEVVLRRRKRRSRRVVEGEPMEA